MLLRQPRSTLRYQSTAYDDLKLRARMKELTYRHRRLGHPRLHILLRREGVGANHKKTHRIYVEETLQVRQRKRKRRCTVGRQPLLLPSRPGVRWSMDFMADQLSSGRRFRVFNMLDDFYTTTADFSLAGRRAAEMLVRLLKWHASPKAIIWEVGDRWWSCRQF